MKGRVVVACSLFVLLAGCALFLGRHDDEHDMSYLYQPAQNVLHPRFLVYHEEPERSVLIARLVTSELMFSAANELVIEQAVLCFDYRLFEMNEARTLVVSDTVLRKVRKDQVKDDYIATIPFPAESGKRYILEVITTDTIRDRAIQTYLLVDKSGPFTRQNFYPVNLKENKPYFYTFVDTSNRVSLRYNQPVDSLYVRFFLNTYPEAPPPDLMIPGDVLRNIPDTSWVIPLDGSQPIAFPFEGMYHIQADTSQPEGITFYNMGVSYPQIKYADQMVGPLSYVATPEQYRQIIRTPNLKLASDNFWLETARNMESARELIRVFYNRVFFANYYFTSYKEGWKTDRGMIYTIYGPPHILYKTDDDEEWIYGNPMKKNTISFVFERKIIPYSDNHYVLRRGEALVTRWGQAIDSWRSGQVYNVD